MDENHLAPALAAREDVFDCAPALGGDRARPEDNPLADMYLATATGDALDRVAVTLTSLHAGRPEPLSVSYRVDGERALSDPESVMIYHGGRRLLLGVHFNFNDDGTVSFLPGAFEPDDELTFYDFRVRILGVEGPGPRAETFEHRVDWEAIAAEEGLPWSGQPNNRAARRANGRFCTDCGMIAATSHGLCPRCKPRGAFSLR